MSKRREARQSLKSLPAGNGERPAGRAIAFWLGALLFGVYLLSFSGRIVSSDGLSMFAVTDSFVKRAEFSTDQLWTFFGTKSVPAPDGQVYSKYGYGTSLLAAPLYALALYVPFSGMMQVTLLSSALAIAITGAFLYLASRRLRFSAPVALALVCLFGFATPAWVYAKEFWSESFGLLTLFGAFYFLILYRDERRIHLAVIAGFWLGLALAVRTTNVLLVPVYAAYGFLEGGTDLAQDLPARLAASWHAHGRALMSFLVPTLLFLASIFLYNQVRFEDPLTTGYRLDETFSNNILLGAYGLLFSPGKGLFVYAPFLAALPFGVWQFAKRLPRELIFSGLLCLAQLLLFSAWYYWWGGTNWAARFLVPTLPFLVLLCAPLLELALPAFKTLTQISLALLFWLLAVVSVVNEAAGVSINSLTYRLAALKLSANADWDTIFQPVLSPLLGHWQVWKPANLEFAWLRAAPDDVQVDWLALGLTLAIILFALYMVWQAWHGHSIPHILMRINIVLVLGLAGIVMARYAGDPRLGGNEGYRQMVAIIEKQADPRDVLILNDDAQARYLLNLNRAPLQWYGLSRDPARWDPATQALVQRLAARYGQVWFAYDDAVDAPNPMRDWLQANLKLVQVLDLTSGVHLAQYHSQAP